MMLGLLWRVLESYDIDPATVIPASTYRPGSQVAGRSYVPTHEYYDLVAKTLGRIDDEAVGIRAAKLLTPSHLGVFGHAWIASPSLLASFRMLQSYARVFNNDIQVRIDEGPWQVRVIYEKHPGSPFPDIDADAQVGGLITFCRLQYGDSFMPLSASLKRREPRQRHLWDEHFGVPVEFGADLNCVTVDSGVAGELLTTAHTALFEQHQDTLAQSIVELEQADIVGRVRYAIRQLLTSASVSDEKVASVVDTNVRTLHRRLSQEGHTFRALLQDVRMDLARRYIGDDRYNVTEVAFMLGYSDTSAFSRAFRTWFGDTPTAFRNELSGV